MGRHAAGVERLPDIDWSVEADGQASVARVAEPTEDVARAVAWRAESGSRDFREARWTAAEAQRDGAGWRLPLVKPASGYAAGLIELRFAREPMPLVLTTGVQVVGAT
jgi:hypothetical protein